MITNAAAITGRLVTLRPYIAGFSEAELTALYSWARDPDVLALSGGSSLEMSFARFRELFLAQLPQHNSPREQLFAILDENDQLIGRTGLFTLDRQSGSAELGIVIGEPSCWGRGYGRDAVRTLVDFGFQELGLRRVVLYTYTANERARRAYEAAGFRAVRELERFSFEGGTHIELEMEITASQR